MLSLIVTIIIICCTACADSRIIRQNLSPVNEIPMKLIHGFIAEAPFYDDAHFPRGFSKSGNFTIIESELLTQVGKRLFMLEQGFSSLKIAWKSNSCNFAKHNMKESLKVKTKLKCYGRNIRN